MVRSASLSDDRKSLVLRLADASPRAFAAATRAGRTVYGGGSSSAGGATLVRTGLTVPLDEPKPYQLAIPPVAGRADNTAQNPTVLSIQGANLDFGRSGLTVTDDPADTVFTEAAIFGKATGKATIGVVGLALSKIEPDQGNLEDSCISSCVGEAEAASRFMSLVRVFVQAEPRGKFSVAAKPRVLAGFFQPRRPLILFKLLNSICHGANCT